MTIQSSAFRRSSCSLLALALATSLLVGCTPKGRSSVLPVLRVASQKGGTKALVIASHVLDGAPYKVEWSEFPAAQTLLEALGAGAVDLGAVGDAPFLFAYANNPKLRVVQAGESPLKGQAVAVVVASASPIHTIADLKGRKIATGKGSIGHYLLLRLLAQAHMKPSEVQILFLAPGDAKAALASGAVDGWATWTPYTELEQRHGGGRILADGAGVMDVYGFEASSVAGIAAKRPQIADFLGRLSKAYGWQRAHEADFAKVLSKETGLPADVASEMVHKLDPTPIRVTPQLAAKEQAVVNTFLDARVISAAPSVAGAFDPAFNAELSK
jgi:sulfonate transport system substrate-binding protein